MATEVTLASLDSPPALPLGMPWWGWILLGLFIYGVFGYLARRGSETASSFAMTVGTGAEVLRGWVVCASVMLALVAYAIENRRPRFGDVDSDSDSGAWQRALPGRAAPDTGTPPRGFTNPWTADDPEVWVRPHLREGRYVEGHWRTRPGAPGR